MHPTIAYCRSADASLHAQQQSARPSGFMQTGVCTAAEIARNRAAERTLVSMSEWCPVGTWSTPATPPAGCRPRLPRSWIPPRNPRSQASRHFLAAHERELGLRLGAGVAAEGADVVGGVAAASVVGEVGEAAVEDVAVMQAELAGLHHQGDLL